MSQFAVEVNNLAKRYRLNANHRAYRTLRETIAEAARSPLAKIKQTLRRDGETFWALKDINFSVRPGEVVGIIGHNGAGKSTLLKILSRITEPSAGYADLNGRVGSLLEVGTGFHPELSGRENIYLSGAILGMKKQEIERRFDEIIAFSEVERFMDTPLKHYSSGMYLRLAFAVAAHLEPEILMIDEVLAVGDMAFQKKCLNKMEDVATKGRTILFVSHNMGAIKELCQTALVLKNGETDFYGKVVAGIQHYSSAVNNQSAENTAEFCGSGWKHARIKPHRKETFGFVSNKEPLEIEAVLNLAGALEKGRVSCLIDDCDGLSIAHNFADIEDLKINEWQPGSYRIKAEIPPLWLKPSIYTLYLKLIGRTFDGKQVRYLSERIVLDVSDKTKQSAGKIKAVMLPEIRWQARREAESRHLTAV